jgi:hypothetical protein
MTQTKEEILEEMRLNHNLRTNDLLEVRFNRADAIVIYKAMDIYAEQSNRQKEDRIKELETELANAKQFIKELLD